MNGPKKQRIRRDIGTLMNDDWDNLGNLGSQAQNREIAGERDQFQLSRLALATTSATPNKHDFNFVRSFSSSPQPPFNSSVLLIG